jgi:phosphoglycolate phosphatase
MCNKVLSILNSKSENTLYVGDSEVDILTAANANLKCISCSWGFRTKDELKFAGANIIIDKPIELLKYLN